MRIRVYAWLASLGMLGAAHPARGQSPTVAVRQLPPATVESRPGVVMSIAALRATATGQVFINDPVGARVVLLDSALTVRRTIADQSGSAPSPYMVGATALFAYRGDSTLLLNASSLSIVVLDRNGNAGRTMAAPRPSDFGQ